MNLSDLNLKSGIHTYVGSLFKPNNYIAAHATTKLNSFDLTCFAVDKTAW